ncbi:MAG: hypothetical protein KC444_05345 [Nitrosopumilus sp.]|nr:hypothetical protein [Nitrosopumilus sp.]
MTREKTYIIHMKNDLEDSNQNIIMYIFPPPVLTVKTKAVQTRLTTGPEL